ncbi:MAG: hypothetical protein WCW30_02040 [Candidatus Gracilibacteria bacterium]
MSELRNYDDDYNDDSNNENPPVKRGPEMHFILGPLVFPKETPPTPKKESDEWEGEILKIYARDLRIRFWNWVLYED